ncbi:hypothetical protein [Coraliomargarita parva]|uniref:hypothetical protein n=1 Tax=Coraliomargarita parva TaxID=3014050 RepID=UPI0022B44116|nr:hypothetical protein [Coraliomargarita parva]
MSDHPPSGHPDNLGKPLLGRKKRSILVIVILASVIAHVVGLGAFAVIKIVDTVTRQAPEFEAVVDSQPTEPPPPPPTQRSTQRSMARPQPMAVANPLSLDVPSIDIGDTNMAMSLTGRGAGGGLGAIGGGMMESLRLTEFGFDGFVEGALEGRLYDMKKDPSGKPIEYIPTVTMVNFLREWSDKRFRSSLVDRAYYSPENKLYATHFIVPIIYADAVPKAYDVTDSVTPTGILLHYRGTFTPSESGRFRFLGKGDDCIMVAVNNRLVLDGSLYNGMYSSWDRTGIKNPGAGFRTLGWESQAYDGTYQTVYGEWYNFRAGETYELDIVVGEDPGSLFGFYLFMENKDTGSVKVFTTKKLDNSEKQRLQQLGLQNLIP